MAHGSKTLKGKGANKTQGRQRSYDVILRHIRAVIAAEEKKVLPILSVCF